MTDAVEKSKIEQLPKSRERQCLPPAYDPGLITGQALAMSLAIRL
jgi:hypothetical protein